MNNLAAILRDGCVNEFQMHYDYRNSRHVLNLTVRRESDTVIRLRFTGVRGIHVSENFEAQWIAQCKSIQQTGQIYVSLDPYDETQQEDERDNYVIIAENVEQI